MKYIYAQSWLSSSVVKVIFNAMCNIGSVPTYIVGPKLILFSM